MTQARDLEPGSVPSESRSMSSEARVTLTTILDIAEAAIRDAQAFEHEHGLSTRHTRKLPANTLRSLHRWQTATASASHGDTVKRVVADGTGIIRAASADKQVNVVCTEEPQVSAGASVTSIRIPDELRAQVDQYAHDRRWSFGEATRVALEQLVGYDQDAQPTDRRTAA
jgi:hypothetical protein